MDKTIEDWKESVTLMMEVYPEAALNILSGKVDNLTQNYLSIEEKQELFRHFIKIFEQNMKKNPEKIDDFTVIFLKLFRFNFFLKRRSDLSTTECAIFINLLDNVTQYKLIQEGFTDDEIDYFLEFRRQIQVCANLVGIYDYIEEYSILDEKRKHLNNK
jgi:hypothetical protein